MRFYQILLISFVCAGLQACVSPKMSQEVQWGKALFVAGDFKRSFHALLPLAVNGNVEAQYAVGYMYYYGYGAPQDMESGLFWMRKAASRGSKPAARALNLIAQGPPPLGPCHGGVCQETGRLLYKGEQDSVLNSLPPENTVLVPQVKRTYRSYLKNIHPSVPLQEPAVITQPNGIVSTKKITAPSLPKESAVVVSQSHTTVPTKKMTPLLSPPVTKTLSLAKPLSTQMHYALQLFGAYHVQDVQTLQAELDLQKTTHIWHTQNKGKDWYVLTYGKYPSVAVAKSAKHKLADDVSDLEPWIRNVNGLEAV